MTAREVAQLRAEFDRKLAALRRELMAERRVSSRRAERLEAAETAVVVIAEAVPVELPPAVERA